MRQAFVQTLIERAWVDPRIILLTGDLGFTVLEPFRDKFPDRFINVGVAEQNLMGIAALPDGSPLHSVSRHLRRRVRLNKYETTLPVTGCRWLWSAWAEG